MALDSRLYSLWNDSNNKNESIHFVFILKSSHSCPTSGFCDATPRPVDDREGQEAVARA